MFKTLTNKDILVELLMWYPLERVSAETKLPAETIMAVIKENLILSRADSTVVRGFFDRHVRQSARTVTVAALRSMIADGRNVLISTPDGFNTISCFYDKLERRLLKIKTSGHEIICSNDHLLETAEHGWIMAEELDVSLRLITRDGPQKIQSITVVGTEPVYDFTVDHRHHRYWGGTGISSHNSGKSFLSCNIIREAQKAGAFILVLDSENALDPIFMSKIGVDVSEDKLSYVQVGLVSDVTAVLSEFITGYEKEFGRNNPNAQKVFIVLDSFDMLLTDSENQHFESGVQKGDQGQRAKQLKHLMRTVVNRIARHNITFLGTHQVYAQDIMLGDGPWAINNAIKYSASQIALITKLKLKEDSEIVGIRMRVETYKSRFAKLGSKVEVEVPYSSGMSKISGLLDMWVDSGIVKQSGAWYVALADVPGFEPIKFQRKGFTEELAEKIIFNHPDIKREEELMIEANSVAEIAEPDAN